MTPEHTQLLLFEIDKHGQIKIPALTIRDLFPELSGMEKDVTVFAFTNSGNRLPESIDNSKIQFEKWCERNELDYELDYKTLVYTVRKVKKRFQIWAEAHEGVFNCREELLCEVLAPTEKDALLYCQELHPGIHFIENWNKWVIGASRKLIIKQLN